jgi:hypothetical protein
MYKDATYREKFAILKEWAPDWIDAIKKDLKSEHLRQDAGFARKYLPGKNLQKTSLEELVEGYSKAVESERVAEFMANRWMLKKSELYSFFERELAKINPDFDTIEEIDEAVARRMIEAASQEFGAGSTYLFSVINSVAFRREEFEALRNRAKEERRQPQPQISGDLKSIEELKRDFEQRLLRIEDKYSKKIDGLERKYLRDTEMLKKQLAQLQRRLHVS